MRSGEVRWYRFADIPSEVALDETDGMPRRCAINLDHVQTVPKARLGAVVTTSRCGRWRGPWRSRST
jgi:mRNA-degrading endonuclease toxin of MazEF toxin-antitoxin module